MITEYDLIDNIAIVTADKSNSVRITMNGERDDTTSFLCWLNIYKGVHYFYGNMASDSSPLLSYKVVLFSGHPSYFDVLYNILNRLNDKVITIFIPEGDIRFYHRYGIQSFSRILYDIWDKIHVIYAMEEDKISFYSAMTCTPAVFVHVPIDNKMENKDFFVSYENKKDYILVYGDNNPNYPQISYSIAGKLQKKVVSVCIDPFKVRDLDNLFKTTTKQCFGKLGQHPFLTLLGYSYLHIYATNWIGSARQSISCALTGTPCIGSDRSHTQKRLFPELCVDIYDIDTIYKKAVKLIEDTDFYKYIVSYAWDNVSFYNMENTTKRFLNACNIGENRRNDKLFCFNK